MQRRLYVSDHFTLHCTYVCELGQEISSNENDGKCLEASRFCDIDCKFLIVVPSIVQTFVSWDRKYAVLRMMGSAFWCKLHVLIVLPSTLQMCASWGRRSAAMGTVGRALGGRTKRVVTCLSVSLAPTAGPRPQWGPCLCRAAMLVSQLLL